MTDLHDKSTSLDCWMHGKEARAAQHITPEDKPMRFETRDYAHDESSGPWRYKVHPEKHGAPGGLLFLSAILIAVLALIAGLHLAGVL